jgi:hypothetical protein
LVFAGVCRADTGANTYYGRLIGSLESQYHGIRGDVYAVDARTLFIKSFSYDGKGQGEPLFCCFRFVQTFSGNGNVMSRSSRRNQSQVIWKGRRDIADGVIA